MAVAQILSFATITACPASMACGTYRVPPLRPELQAAHDEKDTKGCLLAYAVYRMHDDLAWEVNTRPGNIYHSDLDTLHSSSR